MARRTARTVEEAVGACEPMTAEGTDRALTVRVCVSVRGLAWAGPMWTLDCV